MASPTTKDQQAIDQAVESITALKPGTLIDLQFTVPVPTRLKLPIIGYAPGKYIIVRYPNPRIHGNYSDILQPGNGAIARLVIDADGECMAFRTAINYISKIPEPLIFINYPSEVETRQLRQHQRIQIHIPAAITTDMTNQSARHRISGYINDISLSGCRFVFKTDNPKAKVNKVPIQVIFTIPGQQAPVTLAAQVRNSKNENGKVYTGIQFTENKQCVIDLMDTMMIDISALG